jgi:hypothetical protein
VGLCVDSDHGYVGGHCDFGVITRENVGWRGVGEYGHQVEEVRVVVPRNDDPPYPATIAGARAALR